MLSDRMTYRALAGTELKVSAIGMGALGFQRVRLDHDEIRAVVERALDRGVNLLDTAYAYGRGYQEEAIGPVVERRRDECVILTRSHLREPEEFKESVEGSFSRLRTDHIDIFQLHDVSTEEDYEKLLANGVCEMLAEKVEEGSIGYAGVSTHGPLDLVERLITSGRFRVLTVAYNVANRKRQQGDGEDMRNTPELVFPLCHREDVGVTIMKPFGGGVLVQKAPDGTKLSPVDCLRYVLANPYVAAAAPGVENIQQLEEVLPAGEPGREMTPAQKEELEQQALQWGMYFCRKCGYCLPCTEGIEIPQVMAALETYQLATTEEQKNKALESYRQIEPKASECSECEKCQERCPYDLPIMERMKEAADIFERQR